MASSVQAALISAVTDSLNLHHCLRVWEAHCAPDIYRTRSARRAVYVAVTTATHWPKIVPFNAECQITQDNERVYSW